MKTLKQLNPQFVSKLNKFSREVLRIYCRNSNIPRGRDKNDTIVNILNSGKSFKSILKEVKLQSAVRALKLNKHKNKGSMRKIDKKRNIESRCCLCVIEDQAIKDGCKSPRAKSNLDIDPDHEDEQSFPDLKTEDWYGWEKSEFTEPDPHLRLGSNDKVFLASEVNDSDKNVPHSIIAEYFDFTFSEREVELSDKAKKYARAF